MQAFAAVAAALIGAPTSPAVIIFGGGWGPDGNQASIEAHVEALARDLARTQPEVFFGTAAPELPSVQILSGTRDEPGEILALAFDRPSGIDVAYRKQKLAASAPATKDVLLAAIRRAAKQRPTIVFGAGHGTLPENGHAELDLWGLPEDALPADELARTLDELRPVGPTAFVLGQCHSGGFTQIVYSGADPKAPRARPARCVLAAIPADREASGCTPDLHDPSARAYMAVIAEAFADPARTDLDKNGRVSLAEAHAYARIHDPTIDVPVASSETWMREKLAASAPLISAQEIDATIARARPTERAVLEALRPANTRRPAATFAIAEADLAALDKKIEASDEALEPIEDERALLQARLHRSLIERWPELSNPLHKISRTLLSGDAAEVVAFIRARPELPAIRKLDADIYRRHNETNALDRESARLERWLRAAETTAHETALRARNKEDSEALTEIQTCESLEP